MLILSLVAIVGFIAFKIGINSYNLIMETVRAAKGIENIKGEIKHQTDETEEDEIEIIVNFFKSVLGFKESKQHKNTKYAYIQLFKK